MSVNEIIQKRKSVRNYKEGKIVTKEQIKTVLEAGMMAPSAKNTRPWEFIVIQNRKKLEELANIHPHADMVKTAGTAIIVCANRDLQKGTIQGFFAKDCAAATENILLQSVALDLGTCWCGVYPKEEMVTKFREILELPENIVPFNLIAIGIPDEEFGGRGFYEENKIKWID